MATKANRDEMIAVVIEALEENINAEAVSHFLNAAAVVDALARRYTIKPKKPSV